MSIQKQKLIDMYLVWFDHYDETMTDLEVLEKIAVECFLAGEDITQHRDFDHYEVWLVQWAIREYREGKTILEDFYGWNDMGEDV